MLGVPLASCAAAIGVALGIAMSAASTVAIAVQRTFVASTGNDANTASNCSIALPQGNAPNRVDAVVTGTTIVDNAGAGYNGINCQYFGTAAGALTLTGSTISHHLASNATGMQAVGGGCVASVGRTTFARNVTGMSGRPSTLTSFGNNEFDRNGTDIFGTYTTKGTQ